MYVLCHLVIHPQNTVVTYRSTSHVSDMGLGELSQSLIIVSADCSEKALIIIIDKRRAERSGDTRLATINSVPHAHQLRLT